VFPTKSAAILPRASLPHLRGGVSLLFLYIQTDIHTLHEKDEI